MRRQLKILSDFINGFDFIRMAPDNTVIKGGAPSGGSARALVEPGKAMAIYVRKKGAGSGPATATAVPAEPEASALQVDLSAGQWRGEWVDTMTGSMLRTVDVQGGGVRSVPAPDYAVDIALRLQRKQ